ncbi:MAG: T9SS type A sorting domain-containing protein [Flavobacteriales bacterium]|nr:T9SS type A sorting domain-containing protein [Flavobacteriales bacterium]
MFSQCVTNTIVKHETCIDANDGEILITGAAGLEYIWSDGVTTFNPDRTGLIPATYDLDVKTTGGNTCYQNTFTIDPGPTYTVNNLITTPSDKFSNDGEILLVVNGGSNHYSFELLDALGNNTIYSTIASGPFHTIKNLSGEEYFLEVRDTSGCHATNESIFVYGEDVQYTLDLIQGGFDIVDSSVGVDEFNIKRIHYATHENGQIFKDTFNNKSAFFHPPFRGNYDVYTKYVDSTNNNVRLISSTKSGFWPNGSSGILWQEADTTCFLDKVKLALEETNVDSVVWKFYYPDGTLFYDTLTGTDNYHYFHNAPQISDTTISIEVTYIYLGDNSLKSISGQSIYLSNGVLGAAKINHYPTDICFKDEYQFEILGVPAFSYTWNFGNGQGIITGDHFIKFTFSQSGNYPISCKIVTSCGSVITYHDTVQIEVGPSLRFTTNNSGTFCGLSQGAAIVNSINGTGPFTYEWSTGDTTVSIDSLFSGIYYVTATDANGCQNSKPVLINDIGAPNIINANIGNVTCNGGNDGHILLSVSGNNQYFWSTGSTAQGINNLKAGLYYVSITDGNCTKIDSFNVTEPAPLTIGFANVSPTCGNNDGQIVPSNTGGAAPYNYNCLNCPAGALTGLPAGNYVLEITDAASCKNSVTVSLQDSVPLGLSLYTETQEDSCSASSGYVYCRVEGAFPTTGQQTEFICTDPSGGPLSLFNTYAGAGPVDQTFNGIAPGTYGIQAKYYLQTSNDTCVLTDVVKVQGAKPIGDPICLLTVDSLTNHNIVVWSKDTNLQGMSHYNIYRESPTAFGQFNLIDSVPYDSLSLYFDVNSDASISSHRYKISLVDQCGYESGLSPAHKTMHLYVVGVPGLNGANHQAKCYWVKYGNWQDPTIQGFFIYRNFPQNPDSFAILDTLKVLNQSQLLFNWTDAASFNGAAYYVEIWRPNGVIGCFVTKTNKKDLYESTRGNKGTVKFPLTFDIIINSDGISQDGTCDGSATANVVGGIPPYNYQWSTNLHDTASSVNNLCFGNYDITVIDASNDTLIRAFSIGHTSVNENDNDNSIIKVFPNPSTGVVYFEFTKEKFESVNVVDCSGRSRLSKNLISSEDHILDMSKFSKSIYYLQFRSKNSVKIKKLVLK